MLAPTGILSGLTFALGFSKGGIYIAALVVIIDVLGELYSQLPVLVSRIWHQHGGWSSVFISWFHLKCCWEDLLHPSSGTTWGHFLIRTSALRQKRRDSWLLLTMNSQWLLLFLWIAAGDLVDQRVDGTNALGCVMSAAQSSRLPVNGSVQAVGK